MMRLSSISSILHNSTTQIVDIMCLISVDLFCRTLHFKSTGVYITAVGRPQSRRDVIRCFGLHLLGNPELCALERYPAGRWNKLNPLSHECLEKSNVVEEHLDRSKILHWLWHPYVAFATYLSGCSPAIQHAQRCHTTDDLRDQLHWLQIRQRIQYKLGVLVYKCLRGDAPSYLAYMISPVGDGSQRLRSGAHGNLAVPRTVRMGPRSFVVSDPTLWN